MADNEGCGCYVALAVIGIIAFCAYVVSNKDTTSSSPAVQQYTPSAPSYTPPTTYPRPT